jgi:hypothetical protein
MTLLHQLLHEMSPHEAVGTRDQNLHERRGIIVVR